MSEAKEPEGIDEPRVITALSLLCDLGFTALYDAEERPAADIADILNAWADLAQRAEWAEARRHVWEQRARMVVRERRALRVEREALRKDAARYREVIEMARMELGELDVDGEQHDHWCPHCDGFVDGSREVRAALDAALAVQP